MKKTHLPLTWAFLLISSTRGDVAQWALSRRANPGSALEPRGDGTLTAYAKKADNKLSYAVSCKVGTPGQQVLLSLDTGSSDTWVLGPDAGPSGTGAFDPSRSSSFRELGPREFSITYVDGSSSRGDFVSETLEIGGVPVPRVTLGLARSSTLDHGMVGVGYPLNEVNRGHLSFAADTYDNLPVRLRQAGRVSTRAYSLWLNDVAGGDGSILFGGVDTEKYRGNLARVDIQKSDAGHHSAFVVQLTAVRSGNRTLLPASPDAAAPLNVLLDSGSSFSCLPEALVHAVWELYGVQLTSYDHGATLPCDLGDDPASTAMTMEFGGPGGPVIDVPLRQLLIPIGLPGRTPKFPAGRWKGRDACWFGLDRCGGSGGDDDNAGTTLHVLGDTFLRSAYVVYDMVNHEVAMAPAVYNATRSHVVEFASEGARIPLSTRSPNQARSDEAGPPDDPPNRSAASTYSPPGFVLVLVGVLASAWLAVWGLV